MLSGLLQLDCNVR